MKVRMIALNHKVRGVEKGATFSCSSTIARALQALGSAKPVEEGYENRNQPQVLTKGAKPKKSQQSKTVKTVSMSAASIEQVTKTADGEKIITKIINKQAPEVPGTAAQAEPVKVETSPNATDGAIAAAKEHNIDLSTVQGTGENGRIIKNDITALLNNENTGP